MKILADICGGDTAYNWVAFYNPIISLIHPPILTLAKKPPMELIPVYVIPIKYVDQTDIGSNREPVPQMSKVKQLYYGSMLLISKASALHRVVDKKLINRGFQIISKLLHTGSEAADSWRKKFRSDFKSSEDKKGGSTRRSSSGLHASSTRVSTKRLSMQLEYYGLCIKDVIGDGNCLFRSLSDQMIGDSDKHLEYRSQVANYILAHSDEFKPFFSEHDNFEKSITNLSESGTFAGNEALVAFARIYQVDIVIHQLNQTPWRIRADVNSDSDFDIKRLSNRRHCQSMLLVTKAVDNQTDDKISNRSFSHENLNNAKTNKERHELHICYHSYPHYSSVRVIGDARGKTPTAIRLSELIERYPTAAKINNIISDQSKKKFPKLVKLSNVLSATGKVESESAVTRRVLAAVDI